MLTHSCTFVQHIYLFLVHKFFVPFFAFTVIVCYGFNSSSVLFLLVFGCVLVTMINTFSLDMHSNQNWKLCFGEDKNKEKLIRFEIKIKRNRIENETVLRSARSMSCGPLPLSFFLWMCLNSVFSSSLLLCCCRTIHHFHLLILYSSIIAQLMQQMQWQQNEW